MESGSELILLQEKTQKQKIILLKTMNTKKESTVIPEKWVRWALLLSQESIPWESIQAKVLGGEAKWSLLDFSRFENGAKCPGRTRWLAFVGQNNGEKRATQRENLGDRQRVPLKCSLEYWSVPTCKETTQWHGENHLKGLERTVLISFTSLGIIPVPTGHARKTHSS